MKWAVLEVNEFPIIGNILAEAGWLLTRDLNFATKSQMQP